MFNQIRISLNYPRIFSDLRINTLEKGLEETKVLGREHS